MNYIGLIFLLITFYFFLNKLSIFKIIKSYSKLYKNIFKLIFDINYLKKSKDKLFLLYAKKLLVLSLKIFIFIVLILISIFIINYFIKGFYSYLLTLRGILDLFIVGIIFKLILRYAKL